MQGTFIQPETGQEPDSARLFSDATYNVSGRIATTVVGVFMMPLMLYYLGATVYGVWLAALAVVSLCATVDLGMGWAVAREAAASPPGDASALPFLRTVLVGFALTGLTGSAIISFVGFLSREKLRSPGLSGEEVQFVFLLAGIGFFGEWIFTYVQSLLYGLRRFDLWNGLLISVTLIRAAGIAILLVAFGAGLPAVAAWHALCSLSGAIVGVLLAGGRARLFSGAGAWLSLPSVRKRLSFSVLSQLAATSASGLWQAGPILLGYASTTSAVTSLGLGQRLPTAISGVGVGLAETVFPAAAQYQSSDDQEKSRAVLRNGTRWTLWPVLPACLLLFAIGPGLLELWIGYQDLAASLVIRVISLAIICDSAAASALHLLWGRGRSGTVFAVLGVTTGLAVVGMRLTVPAYGALGVAACVLGATLLHAPALMLLAARETSLPLRQLFRSAFRGTLAASLVGALIAFAVLQLLPGPLATRVVVALAAAFAGWSMYTLAFGLQPSDRLVLRNSFLLKVFRKSYPLRVVYYTLIEFVEIIRGTHASDVRHFEQAYQAVDPFHYTDRQSEQERHTRNAELLASYLQGIPQASVCEAGCAEGLFSERLEPLCSRLTALDFSPAALERARSRRSWRATTSFSRFDLLGGDSVPEQFDMVVAMHVVEFARRSHNRRARSRLVALVRPGGYLLLDTQRHASDLENAIFRRYFYRGIWLNRMFARHPELEVVAEFIDDLDVITIYRRRKG